MHKRSFWIAAVLAGTLGGVGCLDELVLEIPSLNGITTDSTRILDSALVGTWVRSSRAAQDTSDGLSEPDSCRGRLDVRIEPERPRYVMRVRDGCNPSDTVVSRAELTRIGRFEYLDQWTEREAWQPYFIPVHFITRVDRHGDSLILRTPAPREDEALEDLLSDAPGVGRLGDEWQDLPTGTTEEMRQWIERRFKPHAIATARSTTVPYLERVFVRAR